MKEKQEKATNNSNLLDVKDRKLLLELFSEERAFKTVMSKRLRISKEVLGYRLKRLESEGILIKIMPIVDYSCLGYHIYRLQIAFQSCTKEEHEGFISYLKKIPDIGWLVELSGSWDLIAGFFIKKTSNFETIHENIMIKFGNIIKNRRFTIVTSIDHLSPNYLQNGERKSLTTGRNHNNIALEEHAKKILKELLTNGILTLSELARKLHVSITTIRYHFSFLESHRIIIGYMPIIDNQKLGYEHFKVMVSLQDTSKKLLLREKLRQCLNVVYITEALGKYDLEFEAEFTQVSEVFALLESLKRDVGIKSQELIFNNKEIMINEVI